MSSHDEYKSRLKARQAEVESFERAHIRFGNTRLVIGIAGAAILYSSFINHDLDLWWIALPIVALIPLMILHERLLRRRTLAQRAVSFYERGIARMEDRWFGAGESGERFRDATHPYSDDFDLFGPSSLFQLLSVARTRNGEETLANWLKAPSSAEVILERQKMVEELRNYLDLREQLFVLGEDARDTVHTDHLVSWATKPARLSNGAMRTAAWVLSALMLGAFAIRSTGQQLPMLVMLAVVAGFGLWLRPTVLPILGSVEEAVHNLGLLAAVLALLEKHEFQQEALRELQQSLRKSAASASIQKLNRLSELIDSRDNVVMRVIGPPLLYGTHLAFAVETWRAMHGPHIQQWLDAMSEFEALLSLAGYSYEHAADPFPTIITESIFRGDELGHPLIPESRCVRNSITIGKTSSLHIVSGSNMSGKSTYLRAIGINAVMAMAGGVVRARSLELCPVQVGAAIRVSDSLQEGSSRFFAEITRLRKIVDLTRGSIPVLFLLDELLNGTNSHDRAVGAEGILRELLQRNAFGLVTTHDLALTTIAERVGAEAINVHFEDTFEQGKLHFDYKVRPGVVKKSNAIELMRSIGLDV